MANYAITGLLEITLPGRTIRFCDGGKIDWGSDTYLAQDSVFGVIASIGNLAEGIAGELPKLEVTFHPAGGASPGDLSSAAYQGSGVKFWLAYYNPETGAATGTPDLQFDGQIDQTVLTIGTDTMDLAITVVPRAERLLNRDSGNGLSTRFHRSIFSGEAGHDDATGLTIPVAWGAESPVTGGKTQTGGFNWGRPL
jgi:hypothetical protein